jgi:hypothetical protein
MLVEKITTIENDISSCDLILQLLKKFIKILPPG